ncbi:hypothetical protein Lal_00032174 [Lupinus albus]|nr:hypothetical protein Lal_00032174 [Lupinus albus]
MSLLVRKFNKLFKMKGSSNRFRRKETRNPTLKNKNSKEKFSCHECGKAGDMNFQCPTYLKKVEGKNNTSRDFKSKKAYIVWDVPEEDSTSSTSGEEETAKICLMVNDREASTSSKVDELSEVKSYETSSCSSSDNSPTYDELYSAFVELHEELKNLVRVSVDRKRLILLHEKKIANIQKEIDEIKLENEIKQRFEHHYSSSSLPIRVSGPN